jgi:hypothetical protein
VPLTDSMSENGTIQKKVQDFDRLVKGKVWQRMKTDEEPLGTGAGRLFIFHPLGDF